MRIARTGPVTGTVKAIAYYLSWTGTSTNTTTNTRTTTVTGTMQSTSVFTNTVTMTVVDRQKKRHFPLSQMPPQRCPVRRITATRRKAAALPNRTASAAQVFAGSFEFDLRGRFHSTHDRFAGFAPEDANVCKPNSLKRCQVLR